MVWVLGALGLLPRVKPSTQGEGHERRYFYGSVWAVAIAQPILGVLWKVLPQSRGSDVIKLVIFVGDPRLRRQPRAPRPPAAHEADRPGRARGVGLRSPRAPAARASAPRAMRRREHCETL